MTKKGKGELLQAIRLRDLPPAKQSIQDHLPTLGMRFWPAAVLMVNS